MSQGKRKSQIEASYRASGWAAIGIIVLIIVTVLFG